MKGRCNTCRGWIKILLIVLYTGLVLFSLLNYRSNCITTDPQDLIMDGNGSSMMCKSNFDDLGLVDMDIYTVPTLDDIEHNNRRVGPGGLWKPGGCITQQKVAIVIPYRQRLAHLMMLLNRLHTLLQRQMLEYRIFVIEQHGEGTFNRGKIKNIGFLEAMKADTYDCVIFHDVDTLPEHDRNLYMCDNHIRQLSPALDKWRYHLLYYRSVGGVMAVKPEKFRKINGYANTYWGWGSEDDDISARAQESGLLITRPPDHVGRYRTIRHLDHPQAHNRNDYFMGWEGRWMHDGINSPATMLYTVQEYAIPRLYTHITVDVGTPESVHIEYHKVTRVSIWWFLNFYFP